jgi:hypothetical protein
LLSITSTRWAPFGGQPDPNQFFVFAFDDDDLQSAFNDGQHDNLSLEPQPSRRSSASLDHVLV